MANGGPGGQLDDIAKREEAKRKASEDAAAAAKASDAAAAALKPITSTLVDPKDGSSLRYPNDIGTTDSDHFAVFDFYDYSAPFSKENQKAGGGAANQYSLTAYNSSAENLKPSVYPQVVLYMPEGVASSYRTNWDGKAFGNVVTSILKSAGNFAGGDYAETIKNVGNEVKRNMATGLTNLGANFTSAIAKRITGDSVSTQDIFSSTGGAILNPNVELIFGGHDLRTLQLTFKMVPYNKTEAEAVDEIVKTFKKVMLPKFNGGTNMSSFWKDSGGGNGFIGNPNLCKITFFKGSSPNEAITQFKTCAITDFDVNYTPDGVAAFGPDGYPVATQISLSFMETKLVYAEDVNSGY